MNCRVSTITTGSPLLSPKHSFLKFLVNQYYLVSTRRERLQILYIKVVLKNSPGQLQVIIQFTVLYESNSVRVRVYFPPPLSHKVIFRSYGGKLGSQLENSLCKNLVGVGRGSQSCLYLAGFGGKKGLVMMWPSGHLEACRKPAHYSFLCSF